ncbi:SMP-30/gluconolactonase/LRE family protein [Methylobrevis sp. L22]|uniref:SMP-30/gluconolactonase/LRE family protein n=2 Tax=Methylobrevis albus TaxID=2793297 RepID=A0A931I1W1_9HYPH|nr:SMP-30/gluconolactonase/LRE family protein [Methylobrevis albus]
MSNRGGRDVSFARGIAAIAGLVLLAGLAYLCLWPVPIQPVAWSAAEPAGFTGPFAPNTRLADLNHIDLGTDFGPEHLAFGPGGRLYAAMTSGAILSLAPDGSDRRVFAETAGRVLGFAFDADGRMIAADAMLGLLAISPDGKPQFLTDRVSDGDPIGYANAVVVAPDGTIYLSDSSTRFRPADWGETLEASVLDILEQSASGRVLAYDPATGETRVVAKGFSFANGIALSSDGKSLFVAETGRYRIWKIATGARDLAIGPGETDATILFDNLPGYPDNLMAGRDGRIWVGLFRPRNPAADSLSGWPSLRSVIARLPRSMLPLGAPYSHVFAIDESGRVVEDLQDPSGGYPETTGATETADRLYVQSLHAQTIGWMAR